MTDLTPPKPFSCMFPGCESTRRRKTFFCYSHWSLVPWVMQRQLLQVQRDAGREAALQKIPEAVTAIERALRASAGGAWNRRKRDAMQEASE